MHFSKTKVMRNVGVEIISQILNYVGSTLTLYLIHQLLQYLVSSHNVVLRQLTQRHFRYVIANFHHLLVHHIQIENQLDEFLDCFRKFACLEISFFIFLAILFTWLIILVIILICIVEFNLPIIPLLMFLMIFRSILRNSS